MGRRSKRKQQILDMVVSKKAKKIQVDEIIEVDDNNEHDNDVEIFCSNCTMYESDENMIQDLQEGVQSEFSNSN